VSERPATSGGNLPPAAVTALLTLRLRSALQDAEAAEAEAVAFAQQQPPAAAAQTSAEVDGLRRTLSLELDAERLAAAARLDAARQEAARIVDDAHQRAAELRRQWEAPAVPAAPVVPAPMAPPAEARPAEARPAEAPLSHLDVAEVDPWSEFARPEPVAPPEVAMAVEAAVAQSIVVDRWADVPATQAADGGPTVVTVDAEAFARVFAAVLATVLDERFAAWRSGMGPYAPAAIVDHGANPAAPAPSLLRRVFHVDVVLSVLAAAIVIVLLFAWLG
jgi:hypothetical protein